MMLRGVVVALSLVATLALAQGTLETLPKLKCVEVENKCNRVWLVTNPGDTPVVINWDWRPSAAPRFRVLVEPGESETIVVAGQGASREILWVYEPNVFAGVPQPNTHAELVCSELLPVCRGRYRLENRVDVPLEFTYQTPIYQRDADPSPAALQHMVVAGNTAVEITTSGEHQREKLFVWLSCDDVLLRREHTALNRHKTPCLSSNELTA